MNGAAKILLCGARFRLMPAITLFVALVVSALIPPARAAVALTEITVANQAGEIIGSIDAITQSPQSLSGSLLYLQDSGGAVSMVKILRASTTSLGNVLLRGKVQSGGRALFVIDPVGGITGRLVTQKGAMQLTTDRDGVRHLWQEGADTTPDVPSDDVLLLRRDLDNPALSPINIDIDSAQARKASAFARTAVSASYPRYGSGDATARLLLYYDSSMTDYISGLADFLIEITNDA